MPLCLTFQTHDLIICVDLFGISWWSTWDLSLALHLNITAHIFSTMPFLDSFGRSLYTHCVLLRVLIATALAPYLRDTHTRGVLWVFTASLCVFRLKLMKAPCWTAWGSVLKLNRPSVHCSPSAMRCNTFRNSKTTDAEVADHLDAVWRHGYAVYNHHLLYFRFVCAIVLLGNWTDS